jgi:hypothetical protein
LPDPKSKSEESVLAGLTILGDSSFELTSTTRNDEDGTVSLGGASDHVLDEVTMPWSIDDLCRNRDKNKIAGISTI